MMNSLILIDASCIAYFVESFVGKFNNADPLLRQSAINWIDERLWLNSADSCSVIWCLDSRPYWRTEYEPTYKGNRMRSDLDISQSIDLIKKFPNCIKSPGFEADDIAAKLCTMHGCKVYLLTTDGDWEGLVNDRVTILNPVHEPRVRRPIEVWGHLSREYKKLSLFNQSRYQLPQAHDFACPEIWRFKSLFGDKGDNLTPGTPIELIDLINPLVKIQNLKLPKTPSRAFDAQRSARYVRALPDVPFLPFRLGVEYV